MYEGMLLLTGATGQVGSALLRRLVNEQIEVRCLVRDPRRLGSWRVRVQIALGDLADPPLVSQRAARRRHGRAPRGVDPRPARRFDRGAQRDRDMARRARRAARGRAAIRVLFDARRLDASPHALSPREGPRRAGGARDGSRLDGVRTLDHLRARRSLADTARAPGAGAGDAAGRDGPHRAISRSGPTTRPRA